jgi:hypothetical protein
LYSRRRQQIKLVVKCQQAIAVQLSPAIKLCLAAVRLLKDGIQYRQCGM